MKKLSIMASLVLLGINGYSQDISLKKGWSLNAVLEDTDISKVFTKSCIETVWTYDSTSKLWKAYSPYNDKQQIISNTNTIGDLTSLKQGQGYWINVTSDDCSVDLKAEESALANPKFKTDDATFDSDACNSSGYNQKSHIASFSPETDTIDTVNGIKIKSNLSPNSLSSKYYEVIVYYKSNTQNLTNKTTTFLKNNLFQLTYDTSWVSTEDNKVYLKYYNLSSDKLPTCKRVNLNNLDGDNLDSEKVFR